MIFTQRFTGWFNVKDRKTMAIRITKSAAIPRYIAWENCISPISPALKSPLSILYLVISQAEPPIPPLGPSDTVIEGCLVYSEMSKNLCQRQAQHQEPTKRWHCCHLTIVKMSFQATRPFQHCRPNIFPMPAVRKAPIEEWTTAFLIPLVWVPTLSIMRGKAFRFRWCM